MKYIVLLGDGMADLPLDALDGRTPLEAAETPVMDALCGMGELGLVRTVPVGCAPGSETANLSLLGIDPAAARVSRSALEASGQGIALSETDTVYRCNLITLSCENAYSEKTLLDHSGGGISTREADALLDVIRAAYPGLRLYTGMGYRHLLVRPNAEPEDLALPHDHIGENVSSLLPKDPFLRELTETSARLLSGRHPTANGLWFWAAGRSSGLPQFSALTGLKGSMICAVSLMKGIGRTLGMEVPEIPGADGTLDTAYEAKAASAVQSLQSGSDFVYIHVEAPDEMGHRGDLSGKLEAIRRIDSRLLAPLKASMDAWGEPYRMLILPDHPTPLGLRTHTADPVPYILYDSTRQLKKLGRFHEAAAAFAAEEILSGKQLLDRLIRD